MSRLNLNHLSDFVHTELVMPPGSLPGREGAPFQSFVECLEQATLTVGRATGTEPPRTADSRPENRDDRPAASSPLPSEPRGETARQADPTQGEQDRHSTGETGTESEPKTDASENPSQGDPNCGASETASDREEEVGAGETKPASDQENDRGEGDPDAKMAGAAGVPGQLSDRQAAAGEDSAAGQTDAESNGQAQPAKPTQAKNSPDATGTLLADESQEAKRPGAKVAPKPNASEDGRTDQQESAEAHPAKNTGDKAAPQLLQPEEAAGQPSDDASQTSADSDAPAQKQKAAPGARHVGTQGSGGSGTGRPGDNPNAAGGAEAQSASLQQDARSTPDSALPADAKAGIAPPPADPNAPGDDHRETTPPTRVEADQGSRRTSQAPQAEPSGSDQAERVRFVQRVARAFEMLGQRGGTIRLRLHPPELGSLRLEVSVRNGAMSARLDVETASARNMLLDNLPALRQRLAEQDIRMERFDVDLTDRPPGGSPQRPGDQPPSRDEPQNHTPGAGSDPRGEAQRPAPPRAVARPSEGTQLDVII